MPARNCVLRAVVLFAALAVSACGDEQSAAKSEQHEAVETPATKSAAPRAATAATVPTGEVDDLPQIETQEDVASEPYSLPTDDPLADVDLENVELRLEATTNIHAAASQLAYLRAVKASWQARQFAAAEVANTEVRAEGDRPAPQVEAPAPRVEDPAPQVDATALPLAGEK